MTQTILAANGILFDLDGTLILSKDSVEKFWYDFGLQHGFDGLDVLRMAHGKRTLDVIREIKPEIADPEYIGEMEGQIPYKYGQNAVPVPGAQDLLKDLPADQWGVVTSGTRGTATGWLKQFLKVDIPKAFITAESVTKGKPDPTPYKLGAEALNLKEFIVFEDAPAGIEAGRRAGATVVGLATTYSLDIVKSAKPDYIIPDMTSVKVEGYDPITKILTIKLTELL